MKEDEKRKARSTCRQVDKYKVFISRNRERKREVFNLTMLLFVIISYMALVLRGWSTGGMILTDGNRYIQRVTRPTATSSTTNPTWQNVNRKT
jgi:hypothetical protein